MLTTRKQRKALAVKANNYLSRDNNPNGCCYALSQHMMSGDKQLEVYRYFPELFFGKGGPDEFAWPGNNSSIGKEVRNERLMALAVFVELTPEDFK